MALAGDEDISDSDVDRPRPIALATAGKKK